MNSLFWKSRFSYHLSGKISSLHSIRVGFNRNKVKNNNKPFLINFLEIVMYLSFYKKLFLFLKKQCVLVLQMILSLTGIQKFDDFLTFSYHYIDKIYSTIQSNYKSKSKIVKVSTQRKSLIYVTSIKQLEVKK